MRNRANTDPRAPSPEPPADPSALPCHFCSTRHAPSFRGPGTPTRTAHSSASSPVQVIEIAIGGSPPCPRTPPLRARLRTAGAPRARPGVARNGRSPRSPTSLCMSRLKRAGHARVWAARNKMPPCEGRAGTGRPQDPPARRTRGRAVFSRCGLVFPASLTARCVSRHALPVRGSPVRVYPLWQAVINSPGRSEKRARHNAGLSGRGELAPRRIFAVAGREYNRRSGALCHIGEMRGARQSAAELLIPL